MGTFVIQIWKIACGGPATNAPQYAPVRPYAPLICPPELKIYAPTGFWKFGNYVHYDIMHKAIQLLNIEFF